MISEFRRIPAVLQRQVVLKLVLGGIAFILFAVMLLCYRSFYVCFPVLLLSALLVVNGLYMIYNCIIGNYLKLEGVCTEAEQTGFRKRIKAIDVKIGSDILHLPIHKRIQRVQNGDTVIIYLNTKTPVYEYDGKYSAYSYYALEFKKPAK